MTTAEPTPLDQYITTMKRRLERAERLREDVNADPELLSVLAEMTKGAASADSNGSTPFAKTQRSSARRIFGGPKAKAHFKKISEYLERTGNEPTGIPAIAQATGLTKSAVIQCAYRSHNVLFENSNAPGHATKKFWRLKDNWKAIMEAAERASNRPDAQ